MKALSSKTLALFCGGHQLSSTYLGTDLIETYPHLFAQKPIMRLAHRYTIAELGTFAYAADETLDMFVECKGKYYPKYEKTSYASSLVTSVLLGTFAIGSFIAGYESVVSK